MFWGLIMEPQRRYTQQVKKSFHISMAALDISTSSDEPAQVMCGFEGRNYLLCTLKKPDLLQCPLDLTFDIGSEVSFAANGKCHVHLTGYLTDQVDLPDLEEAEEEEEEEVNNVVAKSKKRSKKILENGPPNKKLKSAKVSSSQNENKNSDSDESDFGSDVKFLLDKSLDDSDDDSDAVIEEDVEEEEDEDDEDEVDEEEEDSSLSEGESDDDENDTISKKINGVSIKQGREIPENKKKDKIKEKQVDQNKKSPKSEQKKEIKTPNKDNQVSRKKTLQGGVIIEDLKEGQGDPAKKGQTVSVYYVGRLKQNNKVFDLTNKGAGFRFRVGVGDVIKGWDVGMLGMKPGGKRRIICPPDMGYGKKGSPPAIPPNATLMFEVELRKCYPD